MPRQVILTFEDLIYDDYGSVIGQDSAMGYLYWGTFDLAIKHLSTNRTMEGDYVLVF